jgi:hypothetical protein
VFSWKKWEEVNAEFKTEEQMHRYRETYQATDLLGVKEAQHYFIINFRELKLRVWGDFRVKVVGKASFYLWLNVAAIIHNRAVR